MEQPVLPDLSQRFVNLGRPRILVVGDLMLDRYTWGDAERVSPEAPVIVLRADQEEIRPGGAASVAYLLRHLDADVCLAGVVGNDTDGHTLRALLRDEGIDEQFVLTDSTRSTTSKQRFVGRASDRHPHQILRVDRECREPVCDHLIDTLWSSLHAQLSQFDAILIADYLKGVCTERLLQNLISTGKELEIPVLVDPGRIASYERYRGATLLKPNRLETELVIGAQFVSPQEALHAGLQLHKELDISALVITLDRDGLVVSTPATQTVISTTQRSVYDITGAGDMVLATLGLCLASGLNLVEAAELANVAAGLEVERFGIAPISRVEIASQLKTRVRTIAPKLLSLEEAESCAAAYHRQGKRIVFTNGCFDLLHVGHLQSLQDAAALGDVLIVAVNSDASVTRLKGPTRPVISELARAQMLAGMECVDHVVILADDTPCQLIQRLKPHVLAKGGTTTEIVGREIVEAYGGKVHRLDSIEGVSTTQVIASIALVEGTHP